jgi:radical SAM superfamily enzyme
VVARRPRRDARSGDVRRLARGFRRAAGAGQVLHRITGDAAEDELVAPHWDAAKNEVRERLAAELARRGSFQGALHAAPAGRD